MMSSVNAKEPEKEIEAMISVESDIHPSQDICPAAAETDKADESFLPSRSPSPSLLDRGSAKVQNVSDEKNDAGSHHPGKSVAEVVIDIEDADVIQGSDSENEGDVTDGLPAEVASAEKEKGDEGFDDDDDFEKSMAKGEFDVDLKEEEEAAKAAARTMEASRLTQLQEKFKANEDQCQTAFQRVKRFSTSDRMFPDVRLSNFHTVAVNLTQDYKVGDGFAPHPLQFSAKWHTDYVPLPCCPQYTRRMKKRVSDEDNGTQTEKPTFVEVTVSMWDRICNALSQPLTSCEDIAKAIKSYCRFNGDLYILEYATEKLMTTSEKQEFFEVIIPGIVSLCISLPRVITCSIPFLCRLSNHSITFSQKQIACLLANAFFSTFPPRFDYEDDFPNINFLTLLTGDGIDDPARINSKANKLLCIINYFRRVIREMPKGLVTYTRKSVRSSKTPDWSKSTKPITEFVPLSTGTIEFEGERLLQIDFANKYVGGGVLGNGCVQEEILFVIYPELLLSRLFTERLVSSEALVVTGCERFSRYTGYARTFEFAGDFVDCVPYSSKGRKCTQIVAIDALYITKHIEQFHPQKLTREINKAYIGFSNPVGTTMDVAVATGKWGCGAFNGDPHLKAVLQILAASQAQRPVVFFTFGDSVLQNELLCIYEAIQFKTIGEVWLLLHQYNNLFCSRLKPKLNLFEFFTEYVLTGTNTNDKTTGIASKIDPGTNNSVANIKNNDIRTFVKQPVKIAASNPQRDWLDSLEKTKKSLATKSSSSRQSTGAQKLTEQEICDELNANDSNEASEGIVNNEVSKDDKDMREVENDVATMKFTNSPQYKPAAGPKRPNPLLDPPSTTAEADNAYPEDLSCALPRQKRQMTLKDFYGM